MYTLNPTPPALAPHPPAPPAPARGILWGPVTGLAMSELLLHGHASCVDLAPFSPARFMRGKGGGRGRHAGAQAVGEQW